MNNKDRAVKTIKQTIIELKGVIITKNNKILSVSSPEQINNFIIIFELTLQNILSDNIPPRNERALGIANVVADQWPFDIELGSLIIETEQAYKKI
ncbi:hypothetical protein FCL49_11035 [Serratia proteamaculans]|uniref:hypothetical protein n=1 Tax=Serratia proteamaculans TaxID=28151 RepID=UPI001576061D|nr:hypothetical protein [Serratia proteamaculans]NTX79433.1 hypothetical protein [Serratia proteamaculans]NTZ28635.1 hypothetical protein [Serratia proteamaculans]